MVERRITVLIFVSLLLAYLYVFPHWLDWNQNTRFDLAAALIERGTLQIDDYASNTGDYAEFNGHAYSDKAPGLSFLAAPAYALARMLTDNDTVRALVIQIGRSPSAAQTVNRAIEQVRPDEFTQAARVTLTTWLIVALPAALFGAVLYHWLAHFALSARSRTWAVLIYGLATVVAPYSATLYGHTLAAVLLFSAWMWLVLRRVRGTSALECVVIGSWLGFAVITEYPAILIAALIGVYAALTQRSWQRLIWIGTGGVWPLLLLGAYNTAIFGSPFTLTYQYLANPRLRELIQTGVLSAGWPTGEAIWGLTFSPFRGLFFMSPVLLLAVAGFVITARNKAYRAEWWSSLSIVSAFTLLISGSAQWWGGWSAGPRYLIPMLPWLAWPLAAAIDRVARIASHWRTGLWLTVAVLTMISIVNTWSLTTGGQYYVPDDILNPLVDYSWPHIAAGDVARNWGMVMGLSGAASLLPLAMLTMLAFAAICYLTRTTGGQRAARFKTPDAA
ncbi:hypothetical protein TFLX_06243 [Thermoflexales bacterium]|nr:hypothetical protein TFLX_06243 [Thermoflexales bacterium]